jgi:hypothetical protein
MRDTDNEEDREAGGRNRTAERDDSGHGEERGQDLLVLAETIRKARNDWPSNQSDGGSRRQHSADFRRPEPALMEKRRQEWGRDTEGREHCAVEK